MTTTANAPATAALQMIRAEINLREFQRWMGVRRLQDPDHAAHCLLVECFGDLAPKPFRLITPRGAATGCLYGYGQADASALREAIAVFADPKQSRIISPARLDSKPMPAHWPVGKRFGFELRLRPVIRRARGSGCDDAEADAFQVKAETFGKGEMPYTREQVYAQWLADQLNRKGGAALDPETARLVSFQRARAVRKRQGRPVEGPDAVLRGALTVTATDAFAALLSQGIGRHRAYGYGMLLLRPERR